MLAGEPGLQIDLQHGALQATVGIGQLDVGVGEHGQLLSGAGIHDAQVARRFPSFAGAPVIRRHSGPIDATPDLCAIIDRIQPEGLHLAVGMSGSGFKKGPAIGEAVAELVVHGEARTVPIHEFRLSRYAENDPIRGEGYLIAPESTAVLGPANLVH